jgi:acyl-CoA synthetase (NDP forming)
MMLESGARALQFEDAEESVQPFRTFGESFPPRSIAVVGVSKKSAANAPGYTGMRILRLLQEAGFEGSLHLVHPKGGEIAGLEAYPSITDVPEALDLVIIATQAARVPEVLEDCVAAQVANVHICSAGFSETGEAEGRILEDAIRKIAERGALRVIGPNCMGFHVPSAGIKMFEHVQLVDGPVAFVSQSGGHAMGFLMHGPDFGFGFSKVISYGNALTLDAPDFVEYLAGDSATQVICMYLEGVRDGRRLFDVVRRANRVKPVVIWKGGLTESGARAAASHTGSMAGERQVWDAFFRQTGSIPVGSTEEMAEVAMTLLHADRPRGRRAVVLSIGGGNNVASGDICAEEGLELPPLSPRTRGALLEFVSPVNQGLTNPMDVAGVLSHLPSLRRVLEVLVADELIDVIVLHVIAGLFSERGSVSVSEFRKLISEMVQNGRGRKSILVTLDDAYRFEGTEKFARELRQAGALAYVSMRSTCRALRRVSSYREFLSEVANRAKLGP